MWILVLGVLVILTLGVWLTVRAVREGTRPVVALSDEIATQVARALHPTPTVLPDPVTIVREVRTLARLETIQYTVEKVIRAETGQGPFGFLFGDRLLFVAHGVVIAGVDMQELAPQDLWTDSAGRVYIRLPEAQVFIAALDNDKSYVYDRDTGLLTHGDIQLEAAARRAAEAEIDKAAREDGILRQAQENAENYLYRFLRALGFSDVIFVGLNETAIPTASTIPLTTATPGP